MSRTKEMLTSSHNKVVHSDISKMSSIEVMILRSIQENDPGKLKILLDLESSISGINCPVVEISKAKKKPKKTDK